MDAATRLRYLDAMGISLWQRRGAAAQSAMQSVPAAAPEHLSPKEHDPLDSALERAIAEPAPDFPVTSPERKAQTSPVPEPAGVSGMDWAELELSVKNCRQCGLCEERKQAVFGVGVQTAGLMVIGEGPGAEEDRQGYPFVGPAGKLLDAMLAAINHSRAPRGGEQGTYIANVVKCRPPKNRDPKPEESQACRPYLERQIALVQPRLIMAVGRVAAQNLLGSDEPLGRLRTGMHAYQLPEGGQSFPVLVTYHPAYLLRSPQDKRKAWEDLKRARSLLAESR